MIKYGEVEHEQISLHLTMQLKLPLRYILTNKNIFLNNEMRCRVDD